MKFRCTCDKVIRDQTDSLTYKAHYISDQDWHDSYELISEKILEFMKAIDQGKEKEWIAEFYNTKDTDWPSRKTVIEDIQTNFRMELEKTIYQCEDCGRLYIETEGSDYFQKFKLDEHENKTVLKGKK